MSRNPQPLFMLLLAATLAGCGAPVATPTLSAKSVTTVVAQAVPSAASFVTIQAKVKSILPEDHKGLPHQNFIVIDANGQTYEVNNDTQYGSEVPNLRVGETLLIKGCIYRDKNKQGIHWTHHANRTGDAGWIKTPDGELYE